jgi:hypothetical protein
MRSGTERTCLPLLLYTYRLTPTFHEIGFNTEEIQNSTHSVLNNIINSNRPCIERRHGRHNDRPHFAHLRHATQMPQVQRRLPQEQNQPAPFLQHNIGRSSK